MSGLRAIAVGMIVIFILMMVWGTLAEPMVAITSDISEAGDYESERFDGSGLIDGYISAFFDSILIAVFGIMLWSVAWVLKKELTRGQLK